MRNQSTRLKRYLPFLILTAALKLPATAFGYYSTIDTGELVKPGAYQMSLEPQLMFNRYEGFNAVGRFDTGINEQSSFRGLLGVGKVSFQLGGFYKIVPFPDTAKQPAIGADVGVIYARVNDMTETSLRFHPLFSKRFETEVGDFTPYGSLPLGVTFRSDETYVPIQIAGGTEFRPLNLANWSFFAELGININKSFSYLSAAVAYRFDDAKLRSRGGK